MKTLLTGATGLIGRELIGKLESAVVLSRDPEQARRRLPGVEAHRWAPESGPPPAAAFQGVEAVFNLAGEPVAEGRWTAERKRRIRDSRVIGHSSGLRAHRHRARPRRRRPGHKILTPFRLGAGGRLGDGWQWMPWVHLKRSNVPATPLGTPELAGALAAVLTATARREAA